MKLSFLFSSLLSTSLAWDDNLERECQPNVPVVVSNNVPLDCVYDVDPETQKDKLDRLLGDWHIGEYAKTFWLNGYYYFEDWKDLLLSYEDENGNYYNNNNNERLMDIIGMKPGHAALFRRKYEKLSLTIENAKQVMAERKKRKQQRQENNRKQYIIELMKNKYNNYYNQQQQQQQQQHEHEQEEQHEEDEYYDDESSVCHDDSSNIEKEFDQVFEEEDEEVELFDDDEFDDDEYDDDEFDDEEYDNDDDDDNDDDNVNEDIFVFCNDSGNELIEVLDEIERVLNICKDYNSFDPIEMFEIMFDSGFNTIPFMIIPSDNPISGHFDTWSQWLIGQNYYTIVTFSKN